MFFWWSVKQKHRYFDRAIRPLHLVLFHLMRDHRHRLYRKIRIPQGLLFHQTIRFVCITHKLLFLLEKRTFFVFLSVTSFFFQ